MFVFSSILPIVVALIPVAIIAIVFLVIIFGKTSKKTTIETHQIPYDEQYGDEHISSNRYDELPGSKTFEQKLKEADELAVVAYDLVTAELERCEGVKSKKSSKAETFRRYNRPFAKLTFTGKTLKLYLALAPSAFDEKRYRHNDESSRSIHAETPLAVKLRSHLSIKRAIELIKILGNDNNNSKITK
jgi:hypothetical protein